MIWILTMSLVVSASVAQSTPEGQQATQETQARGFWIDPSTKLMWVAKDSGKDMSYKGAMNYCRDLRLAGYSDWRLATLDELQGISDKTANAPGLAGPHGKDPFQFHVKGNLFLTGDPWAHNLTGDTGGGLGFDFNEGKPAMYAGDFLGESTWSLFRNRFRPALCVRYSVPRVEEASDTQVRGFWTDSSTGLMWAAKDSGTDVNYKHAVNYCHDLRLAGHSDWRLATVGELQSIYDKTANAPGLAGRSGELRMLWHVKGNLFLTGDQWAYDQSGRIGRWEDTFNIDDGSIHPSGLWHGYSSFMRALCVRGPGN